MRKIVSVKFTESGIPVDELVDWMKTAMKEHGEELYLKQKDSAFYLVTDGDPCGCRKCVTLEHELLKTPGTFDLGVQYMIVCETCGNKRCPHATDHDLTCTASNEPGQAGSIY